jgi:hypothetical protein
MSSDEPTNAPEKKAKATENPETTETPPVSNRISYQYLHPPALFLTTFISLLRNPFAFRPVLQMQLARLPQRPRKLPL